MSSIDERVVSMKFDNTQFQKGVSTTTSALDALKKNLNFDGAKKGLEGLSAASKGFSLSGMAQGIDTLVSKFGTLNIVGITALTNLVNKATNAGLAMAKSLTLDPIKAGFDEYELKMGSIQTILSNTARYGTKLPEVTKNLDALNKYADKTIYNFGDMTKNIGLFTNSGMRVGDATTMIKGFSNEAAASGTSAEGAAGAAYQLSQAMSAGKVTLMDWRSLQNVGMGNANMKKGIIDIAQAMGTMKEKGVSSAAAQKDFNGTLEKGWLTADVMTKYMKIMSGEMTDAQMKQLGLSKTQIDAFKIQQKNAEEAATKVRTFTQLVGTIRESVGSGWTDTFDFIIGDFNKATELWTGVNNTLGGMITNIGDARNKMLGEWAKLGGRDALIGGLGNAFKALMAIIKPIHDAFREIFPATTGKQLADATKAFQAFTKGLIMGKDTAAGLKSTFKGLFAILSIAWSVIKGVVGYFATFFSIFAGGSGSIFKVTGSIGDMIVALDTWLKKGDKIGSFFKGLADARTAILVPVVAMVSKIVAAFALLFKGDFGGFGNALKASFSGFEPIVAGIQDRINHVLELFNKGINIVKSFFGVVGNSTHNSFVSTLETIQHKVEQLQKVLNQGVGAVRDFINGLNTKINSVGMEGAAKATSAFSSAGEKASAVWNGVVKAFSSVSSALAPINDKLGAFFGTLADKITEYIKGLDMQDAVALLNTGFFIAMYSMMRKFIGQLKELTSGFADVLSSIAGAFDGLTNALKAMQQNVQATILIKIAVAIGLLAVSLLILSKLDIKQLAISLGAITVMMVQLLGALKLFSTINPASGVGKAAGALVLMAIAINILASAVKKLSGLGWDELAKGLVGVGTLLAALALFTKFAEVDKGGVKSGAGLILLGIAINILASAVQKLGSMDTGALVKGIAAMGVMIGALAVMVNVMNSTKGIPQAAIGLLILSGALMALTVTMRVYAALDWGTLIHGLATMAGTLVLVGGAMRAMPKDMVARAAGLLIVAGALIVLAGALKIMGGMSAEEMAKGLIALTVSLAAIAISLQAMEASLPGAAALIVAAAAITVLAVAMNMIGSMDIESIGKALLGIAGVLAILGIAAALMIPLAPGLAILATAVQAMGLAMLAAGAGFALFAGGFAVMAAVGTAGVAVLIAAFTGILNLIPLFMEQIALGLRAFAKVIADSGPIIIAALTTLLLSLLAAIDRVIPTAIATMVRFILGLLKAIQVIAPQFVQTIGVIVMSMVNKIASLVPQIANAGLRMINGFLKAVGDHVGEIVAHATKIVTNFLDAIGKAVPRIVEAGYKMVLDILNGVTDSVNNNSAAMGRAGGDLAVAIIRGMVNALREGVGRVVEAARGLASDALQAARNLLGIHSPSREFYKVGTYVVQGFVNGIKGNKAQVTSAFDSLKGQLSSAMKSAQTDVANATKKLAQLTSARVKDWKAINDTKAALATARSEYAKSSAAYKELTTNMNGSKARLLQLADQYDSYTGRIKAANDAMAEAVKIRDEFAKQTKEQYDGRPTIGVDTTAQSYVDDLRKKISDMNVMGDKLANLRKLGLNDEIYKDLVAKGADAMPFIDQLLGTGKSGVAQVNQLSKQLEDTAAYMGMRTAGALYQAGVDSAAGIVKGLQSQQNAIDAQMNVIADAMVRAIKAKLGIKSPSREFMKVGKFSAEGLAQGLDQHVKMVEKSASSVGVSAIDAMRKSITGLDQIVADNIRTDPVITPVLDLSAVRKDATKMGAIFDGHGISVSAGYTGAKNAAEGYQANVDARQIESTTVVEQKQDVNLTQNNYSPRAIAPADTYRATKSLISTAKGALGK